MKENNLNRLLTSEINENHPHWITTPLWAEIKYILEIIRILLINDILSKQAIEDITKAIVDLLDDIATFYSPEDLLITHKYITDIFNYYFKLSIDNEIYETSANMHHTKIQLLTKTQLFRKTLI